DPYTKARLYWSEGRLRSEQGQDELAANYLQQALETLRATEDTYAIARAHHGLAHIYLNQGRAAEAPDLLRQGWPLIEQAATPRERLQALGRAAEGRGAVRGGAGAARASPRRPGAGRTRPRLDSVPPSPGPPT